MLYTFLNVSVQVQYLCFLLRYLETKCALIFQWVKLCLKICKTKGKLQWKQQNRRKRRSRGGGGGGRGREPAETNSCFWSNVLKYRGTSGRKQSQYCLSLSKFSEVWQCTTWMVQAERNDQDLMAQYTFKTKPMNMSVQRGTEFMSTSDEFFQLSCLPTDSRRWFPRAHYRLIHYSV